MKPPNRRAFTPARIVALALLGLTVLALGYLRLAPDDRLSVPVEAKAGDLTLEPCTYATEDGRYDADCGTLVVPENRAVPASRLIAVPVTRVRARSAHPKEPVFRLEGGPGITNMQFPRASRFARDRDVVLVGYRGVDGSSVLDCPEVESAVGHSTDRLGEKSFRAYAGAFRACAARLTDEGVDLAGYSMSQQADDLEGARKALGYGKIDLLSESAGTRLALIYAWRYPGSVHRSVMVGANPPGHFFWDPRTTDAQIGRYAKACDDDASCRGRTDDLVASMRWTSAHVPDRWWFLPIDEANVRIASFFGLFETTTDAAPVNGPLTVGSWLSAADGDASGFWLASLAGDLVFPKMFTWGEYAAIGTQDAWAVDAFYRKGGDKGSILGNPGTDFAWGGGRLGGAWPTSADDAKYRRMRSSSVETLLVGGELDVSTPPQVATRELLPYLPNGRQVVLPGFGHSASFWTQQPEAGTRLVSTFLSTGRVDHSLYEPQRVDFAPSVSQGGIAKIALGSIVALAALAVLSVVAMALRVRWRGPFGPKTSAVLRSVYAIVLGLGGWLAGVLIALTAMPGVPLDDELLATFSVAVPVGLGVYLAWVNRDRASRTRAIGFAAALAGALVGGWLGFNATEGIAALLTTIAGAVAGSNLVLLVLDIAWDCQARDGVVESETAAPARARPAAG
jgi:pimeloyl-ACP methyl ester carboxylesterase